MRSTTETSGDEPADSKQSPEVDDGGLSATATTSSTQKKHVEQTQPRAHRGKTHSNPGVFGRAKPKEILKTTAVFYAVLGVAVGASGFLVVDQLSQEQLLILGGVITPALIALTFITPSVLAGLIALHIQSAHPETGKDLYVFTAVVTLVGSLLFMATSLFVLDFGLNTGLPPQDLLAVLIAAAIPAAITGVAASWTGATLAQ